MIIDLEKGTSKQVNLKVRSWQSEHDLDLSWNWEEFVSRYIIYALGREAIGPMV